MKSKSTGKYSIQIKKCNLAKNSNNLILIKQLIKTLTMRTLKLITLLVILISFVESDIQKGIASYYGNSMHGRRTYSGEKYHKDSLTAAHRSLPMGTRVKVTNLKNDSVVIVKINDRMGNTKRVIDLSMAAAKKLNFVRSGLTTVTLEKLEK
jgi:rare lipoprotein A